MAVENGAVWGVLKGKKENQKAKEVWRKWREVFQGEHSDLKKEKQREEREK